MKVLKLPYPTIPLCSRRDIAYIEEVAQLQPFYKYPVSIDSFKSIITDKSKEKIDRQLLVSALQTQYSQVEISEGVKDNLEKLLLDNTFTVTTAHQPCLFTGPLYYIYKIISTLKLAKRLKEHYPTYHFVPVFVNSGEDHDFAEVNHAHIYGKKIEWESGEAGPVGEMGTASLGPTLDNLKSVLGSSDAASKLYDLIARIFARHHRYEDAVFEFVHELFKDMGLVIVNTIAPQLKKSLVPIIKDEILNQASENLVKGTIKQLDALGFSAQASPREINFFYLGPNFRERIVKDGDKFKVLNTGIEFTAGEMELEIENHPWRFSPNVVMRPIYQEKILPNLAYIGGGGEIAYWLERKVQFEYFGINFPMLVRRDSAMWIDGGSYKKLQKLGLSVEELWADNNDLIRAFLQKHSEIALEFEQEKSDIKAIFEGIAQKAANIDPTIVNTVWAEHSKVEKGVEALEAKLVKAEKLRQETSINQIINLKEKLMPGGGLQERHDNFIPFYLKHGTPYFQMLMDQFDPIEKKFTVFIEE